MCISLIHNSSKKAKMETLQETRSWYPPPVVFLIHFQVGIRLMHHIGTFFNFGLLISDALIPASFFFQSHCLPTRHFFYWKIFDLEPRYLKPKIEKNATREQSDSYVNGISKKAQGPNSFLVYVNFRQSWSHAHAPPFILYVGKAVCIWSTAMSEFSEFCIWDKSLGPLHQSTMICSH